MARLTGRNGENRRFVHWLGFGWFSMRLHEGRALGIVRVNRSGAPMTATLKNRENGRENNEGGQRGGEQAADDGAAKRSGLLAAFTEAEGHRQHAGHHSQAG